MINKIKIIGGEKVHIMEKVLKINLTHFGAYPAMSHALSILKGNLKYDTWIYNNFLQLFSVEKKEEYVVDFFDFNIENTPFLDFNTINKKWILNYIPLHTFLKSLIDQNSYIIFFINTQYIKAYKNAFGSHDPMIYGYNDEKKIYYMCDHTKNGKYTTFICSFRELEEALSDPVEIPSRFLLRNKQEVEVFRIVNFDKNWNKNKLYLYHDFDGYTELYYEKIINTLQDFLHAKNTIQWGNRINFMTSLEKNNHNFGINCYMDLKNHIERAWGDSKYSEDSLQTIYVFYAYTGIMLERLGKISHKIDIRRHVYNWNNFMSSFRELQNKYLLEIYRKRFSPDIKKMLIHNIDYMRDTHIKLTEALIFDLLHST